ncbi:translocation protein in type III secretion [Pandoraea iniqua]|uniref:Translocation protein in type III secretion n=1 Tax=Pandoraea iniqua TaxID=2508288 RepID=A0A5E4T853_9BURK|nr:hypothetical protein [Pandoraea iniqua]VVD84436.1 translocation protein in type III secretion [Pandoraea iniqua]
MHPEANVAMEEAIADEVFADMLGGGGSVHFAQGDLQVQAGWLRIGGEGLIVTARIDEGTVGEVRFWCDTQQWREWLAPWLPVPTFDALPEAWHDIAASLTLASNPASDGGCGGSTGDGDDGGRGGDAWPQATRVTPSTVGLAWRVGVVLHRDGRRLALAWIDGAASWLRERCERAEIDSEPIDPAGLPQRECLLVAGWADISRERCDALRAGDAVILSKSADVAKGAYWVIDGDYALSFPGAHAGQRAPASGVEVLRLNPANVNPEDVTTDAPSLVRIFAMLSAKPFPVPVLNAWRTGQLPAAPSDLSPTEPALHMNHVTLWRDGAARASARLLCFEDGQLAVCLEGERGGETLDNTLDNTFEDTFDNAFDDTLCDIAQSPANSGGDPMGVHPLTS